MFAAIVTWVAAGFVVALMTIAFFLLDAAMLAMVVMLLIATYSYLLATAGSSVAMMYVTAIACYAWLLFHTGYV